MVNKELSSMHDFTGKLLQPSTRPVVLEYLTWRRAVRAAAAAGEDPPALPSIGPISINLDLTTACNYACDHCIDWEALNISVKHEEEELRASIVELKQRGLQSVILLGGGEPTLYPGFGDFVRFLKGLDLEVAVVTNGSRNEVITEVADCFTKGDWVRLSLDSAQDDTFQAMHHPKGRGIHLDDICERAGAIKAKNADVSLGYSFVITWNGSEREAGASVVENLGEMAAAAKRAKDAGFDYISFKPFLTRAEDGAEVMNPSQAKREHEKLVADIRAGVDAAMEMDCDTFRVVESINLRVFLDGSWENYRRQPGVCHMQALRQVLSPLGVFNCPAHRGVEKARIGNKCSWSDASAMEGTAKLLNTFNASKECAEVTCLYHSVNHFLEGIVSAAGPLDDLLPEMDQNLDTFL